MVQISKLSEVHQVVFIVILQMKRNVVCIRWLLLYLNNYQLRILIQEWKESVD